MTFADRIVIALGDPGVRTSLLDDDALAAIVAAGYDASSLGTTGPYVALFNTLELAPDLSAAPTLDGTWMPLDGGARVDAHLAIRNLGDPAAPAVAATWAGSISAKAVVGDARVSQVAQAWSRVDGMRYQDHATVTYTAAPVAGPGPTTFPIVAAVFIADAGVSLLELLRQSALARTRLAAAQPVRTPPNLGTSRLPVVLWIVNQVVFDDAAWPGASAGMTADQARTARRDRADSWLAGQHIAIAVAS
jgi:hypothetical protein